MNVVIFTDGLREYPALHLRELEDGLSSLVVFVDDQPNPFTLAMGFAKFVQAPYRAKPNASGDWQAGTWRKVTDVKKGAAKAAEALV